MNLQFPTLNATLYISYNSVQKDKLDVLVRDAYNFAVEGQKRSEATWAKNGELIRVNATDQADFVRRMQTVGPEVVAKNPRIKDAYELMVERANATRK